MFKAIVPVFSLLLIILLGLSQAQAEVRQTRPNSRALPAPINGIFNLPGASDAWLGLDGQVTEARVERILTALRSDAEGARLAEAAIQNALLTSAGPFWKVVKPCPSTISSDILGQASSGVITRSTFPRDPAESAFSKKPDGSTDLAALLAFYSSQIAPEPRDLSVNPDVLFIRTFKEPPGICLKKSLTIREAVSVLFHEIVHFNAMSLDPGAPIESFESKQAFELDKVLKHGDEVDAYISEWSFDIRNHGKTAVPNLVEPFFKDDGTFMAMDPSGRDSRQAIARLILDGPIFTGTGYSLGRFLSEYPNSLGDAQSFWSGLVSFYGMLQANHQGNLPFFQQQFDFAKGPAALKAKAILEEDRASVARLSDEQKGATAQVSRVEALIEKFKAWQCDLVKIGVHVGGGC